MESGDENYLDVVETEFQCLKSSFVDEKLSLLASSICRVNAIHVSSSRSFINASHMFVVLLNYFE